MIAAIIAAGGRGERLGGSIPKQLIALGDRTVLQRSVEAFALSGLVDDVIVVLPAALIGQGDTADAIVRLGARVVAGGARRQDSVALGFDAVRPGTRVVLVHDAARPFVSRDVIARTIAAAEADGAAIAAVQARDTVKRATDREGHAVVEATIPRDEVFLAQTPQGFRYDVLREAVALGRQGAEATDEAMLAERAGHAVTLVEGDVWNFKITTEADLVMARAMGSAEGPGGSGPRDAGTSADGAAKPAGAPRADAVLPRVGIGYDLHRTVEGRPLILGGIRIPHDRGLAGHSDADAIAHAVTDAVLGAASLGDIGELFPDTDPRWKDADSMMMLAEAMARLRAAGYRVANVDVVVIAERPKIGPHRAAIRERLAAVLGVTAADVGVKGKTNEGVDATGRGEALAVQAIAVVVPDGHAPATGGAR